MPDTFVRYRTYNDKALANTLCALLQEHEIPFEWESTEGFFDVSFANNDILNLYYVKIRQSDFAKADQLLMDSVIEEKQEPVGDYYLFSFSNEELLEVIHKPDEWNEFDVYWAGKILATRGVEIKPEQVQEAKKQRIKEWKKPWVLNKVWIVGVLALWLFALWAIHIGWSVVVIFIGIYIAFSKRVAPDGQKVYAFSPADRLWGKIWLVAGVALSVFILLQYWGFIEFIREF